MNTNKPPRCYKCNKSGASNIVSLLLTILIVFGIASTMYFWLTKIQSESQQIGSQYQEKTLSDVVTEVTIVDDVVYNTLAEGKECLPATLTITIQNTGANTLKVSNDSEILISRAEDVICLSKFDGVCLETEYRLYAASDNRGSANSNITYTTDGVNWLTADDNVGAGALLSSASFNDMLFFGGFSQYPDSVGAQVFKSCDLSNWAVDTSFPSAEKITSFEIFNQTLYAGISSPEGTVAGRVYRRETNLTWTEVYSAGERDIRALEVFNNWLYAGVAFGGNLTRTPDGANWSAANGTLGNVTALKAYNGYLYAGLDGGEIWRSSDGADFGSSAVKLTGDDAVLAFEVFNNKLYAGTNKSGAASIFEYDGSTWTEVYQAEGNSNNDSVNDFAVFNGYIYAVLSSTNGGAIIRSNDGSTWTEVYTDGVVGMATIVNYTYCKKERVSCLNGCDSDMAPGETRTLELQLSNTDCDISSFGTSTEYNFRINFGSTASVSGRFGKNVVESSNSNSLCEYTYPLCNGVCFVGGVCATDYVAGMCVCVESMPCEAVPPFMFSCSIGTGCGEQSCEFNSVTGVCECV